MKQIGNAISYVLAVISVALMLWFFVSWAQVVTQNTRPNPTYPDWNMFVMMTEHFDQSE